MPCKGLLHPLTRETIAWADLADKFDADQSWRNGRAAAPAWVARYMEHLAATDDRHDGLNITNTRTTTCPRETFIRVLLDYYRDPSKAFTPTRGTGLHEVAGAHWPENYLTETHDRELLTLKGTLFGVALTSHADVVRIAKPPRVDNLNGAYIGPLPRPVEIINTKFPLDWSVRWRSGKNGKCVVNFPKDPDYGRPDSNAIQLNIDRLLLAQQSWAVAAGYDPDDVLLTVWDHGCGESEGPEPLEAPHASEDDMLSLHPGGGVWTLREIVDAHRRGLETAVEAGLCNPDGSLRERETDDGVADDAGVQTCAALPLVGQAGMFGGKKCTKYCDVEPVCSWLVRQYGMPAGDGGR